MYSNEFSFIFTDDDVVPRYYSELIKSGRFAFAEQGLRVLAQHTPLDMKILHLHGVSLLRLGKLKQCVDVLQSASRMTFRENAQIERDLGYALLSSKRIKEAGEAFERSIRLGTKDPDVSTSHSRILLKLGNLTDAKSSAQHALSIDAEYPAANLAIAECFLSEDDYEAAIPYILRALRSSPDSGDGWQDLLSAQEPRGFPAIEGTEDIPIDWLMVEAHRLARNAIPDKADRLFRLALSACGDDYRIPCHYAAFLLNSKNAKSAIEILDRINRSKLQCADREKFDSLRLDTLIALGDRIKAEDALFLLSRMDRDRFALKTAKFKVAFAIEFSVEERKSLKDSIERLRGKQDRISGHFLLSSAYGFSSLHDERMRRLHRAHHLCAEELPVSPEADAENTARLVSRMIRRTRESFIAGNDGGVAPNQSTPVFLVGLFRSGSSLVEQVLTAHSEVGGMGESAIFHRLICDETGEIDIHYPLKMAQMRDAQILWIANRYISESMPRSPSARFITDKFLDNLFHIHVIARAFPRAKIIWCDRNPYDVAISIYSRSFPGGTAAIHSLESIAKRWIDVHRLMDHWTTLGIDIHRVHYEDFVVNFESSVKSLFAYIGIPPQPLCFEPHKNPRIVHTASHAQVKRPIYLTSIGGWRKYENHLDGVRKLIEDSGVQYPYYDVSDVGCPNAGPEDIRRNSP